MWAHCQSTPKLGLSHSGMLGQFQPPLCHQGNAWLGNSVSPSSNVCGVSSVCSSVLGV